MKAEIETYSCKICNESFGKPNLLSCHIKKHHNVSIEDYIKNYINLNEIKLKNKGGLLHESRITGLCKICNKPTKLNSIIEGFNAYCSQSCSKQDKDLHKLTGINSSNIIEQKYGVKNISQLSETQLKVKKTKLEKYGSENYINVKKIRKTNFERYGSTWFTKTQEYKVKTTNTYLKKYGVEHSSKSSIIKEKTQKTCIEKYGTKNPLQSKIIRDKINQTNIEKYGVKSILYKKEIRDIGAKILQDRFKKRLSNHQFENLNLIDSDNKTFECILCKKQFQKLSFTINKEAGKYYPHCEDCFPIKNNKNSLIQQELICFINNLNVKYRINDRSVLKESGKELDIYFPDKNIAIEINGLYWHSEIFGNKNKNYHLFKTNICENQNIHLIHLFSDEWDIKKDIVKEKIKHILNVSDKKKIHARKCIITSNITNKIKNDFLNQNHIQGSERAANVKIGAYFNNELIALMTFCKPRISLGQKTNNPNNINCYELLRFATKKEYICAGIADRLLKYFIKNFAPKKIITYADRRWSRSFGDNLYLKLGFKYIGVSSPNYWYLPKYTEYKTREGRFQYRKNNLEKIFQTKNMKYFDSNLSEWENMKMNGYDRIWDCGNLKYEMIL